MRRSTCTKKQTATARLNEYEVSPHIHSILNQKTARKNQKSKLRKGNLFIKM
jgi:arsenate reductase-like glutaredoxin family protein